MTAGERRTIGIDRPIQLDWLDAVAGRLATGAPPREAREFVWGLLEGVVAGNTPYTARGKTMTVLGRVWLNPPVSAVPLRDSALKFIESASAGERLAIHWALLSAAYPFFVDVATSVGKTLGLSGEIALAQLNRRIVEVWGDRTTLRPAVQRLTRSMVHWGVLRQGDQRGVLLAPEKRIAVSPGVSELLLEGLLIAAGKGMALNQLVRDPGLFPFEIQVDVPSIRKHPRMKLHRQGDRTDFVELELPRSLPTASTDQPNEEMASRKRKKVSEAKSPNRGETDAPSRRGKKKAMQDADGSEQLSLLR